MSLSVVNPLDERSRYPVARFVYRIIPSPEDREEVCQDVFVKAFFNISKYRGDAKLSTWLFQIAYRTAISFKRKRVLSQISLEDYEIADTGGDHLEQDGVSREIANIVERPAGTVKSILHRARGKLKDRLEPDLLEAEIVEAGIQGT